MGNKKEPIRVAHVVGKWVGGGVEAVVMNYYRNIDHNKIQFDFIFDDDSNGIPYDEIESLGGKVFLIPPYQKVFKYQKELQKVLKKGNYKIVHSHINALSVFPLRAAKKVGIPVRIAHSHSTTNKVEWKKNLLKLILRPFSKVYATDYFACTEHAGRWLFGNKTFEQGQVYVLNNAIDVDKFKYSEITRKNKRKELNINDDTIVIGHIGRFVEQKNHKFLIEIFEKIYKEKPDSVLLLIGQGPLELDIRKQVKDLGLQNSVLFLGQRNDTNELYQAMDLFIFPSLYEGLGMVLIEAQASGCYCIASTEVPKDAKLTENCKFINLNDNAIQWSQYILNDLDKVSTMRRIDCSDFITKSGYNIRKENINLEKYYLKEENSIEKEYYNV